MKVSTIVASMASMASLATLSFAHKMKTLPATVTVTPDLLKITSHYCFGIEMDEFLVHRNHTDGPPELDWSSNGCSHVSDHPMGYNFLPSCWHHDFGYRNFKKQGRFNHANKKRIDRRFQDDLYEQCDGEKGSHLICKTNAKFYYLGVRWFVSGTSGQMMASRAPELAIMTEGQAKKALLSMELMEEMYPDMTDLHEMDITEVLDKMLGVQALV